MPPQPNTASYFAGLPQGIAPDVVDVLDACLTAEAEDRPDMQEVRDVLARHLLFGKHQALVVYANRPTYLNTSKPSVNLKVDGIGQVGIHYNGLEFLVQSMAGEIFINNQQLAAGVALPGSCVIAFGAPERGSGRTYVTVDVSHPEVVL